MMSPANEKELREKAARFYWKNLPGWLGDWVDDGEDVVNELSFEDVADLHRLLVEVYELGARSTQASAKGET